MSAFCRRKLYAYVNGGDMGHHPVQKSASMSACQNIQIGHVTDFFNLSSQAKATHCVLLHKITTVSGCFKKTAGQ